MKATTASILALNREAVSLMQETRYIDAANLLAFGTGYNDTNVPSHDDVFCEEGEENGDDSLMMRLTDIPTVSIGAVLVTLPESIRAQEKLTSFTLFPCAIEAMLPGAAFTSLPDIMESKSQCRFLSGILHYNMALSLHLSGLSTANSDHLSQALIAYHSAVVLLDDNTQDRSEILLQLAIMNNCGHIQSFSHNTTALFSTLEDMEVILFDITDGGDAPLPQLFSPFLSNAFYNRNINTRAASAA